LKDANIGNVNPYWYQKINSLAGATNPDITLYFDDVMDNIPAIPTTIMTQWAWNAPPIQWRALSTVLLGGAPSPALSTITKVAWVSFNTENFDIAPQSIPLPVELVSFTGICKDEGIHINWITSSEVNNDYFILEKSEDGNTFEEISRLNGSGTTSTITEYNFTDLLSSDLKMGYYRLRQFDFDGNSHESKMILVDCTNKYALASNVFIFPNPASTTINILINQSAGANTKISIVNLIGQFVYTKDYSLEAGFQSMAIDISNLASGMYQVVVENEYERVVEKIVKGN